MTVVDEARRHERTAGWVLIAGSALLILAVFLYGAGQSGNDKLGQWKPAALGAGLLVTLFGLIAFTEALTERGEWLLPRCGWAAFAIGTTAFMIDDAINYSSVGFVFELERIYTVLACVAIALFGWSILRSMALPDAVGLFAINWAFLDGFLYVSRVFQPPLGPNLATLLFGIALLRRSSGKSIAAVSLDKSRKET